MGGGILQLVTKGVETIYLTDNPQITIFKNIYRRHTNFSLFEQDLHFKGKFGFGNINNIKIRNIGDILYGLGLHVKLPYINLKFKEPYVSTIKIILKSYDIIWDTILEDNELITLDYYNTNILPLVTQEISTQLTSYNKYNDYLKILDENYEKQPNVNEGDYYIVDNTGYDHSIIAVDSNNINLNPANKNYSELYVLVDISNNPIINNIISNVVLDDIILKDGSSNIIYTNKDYLNNITVDTDAKYYLTNNSNWIKLLNATTPVYKYVAFKKSKLPQDLTTSTSISISPDTIQDTLNKIILFQAETESKYYAKIPFTDLKLDINNTIELFKNEIFTDESNIQYFFVDSTGHDLTTNSITFSQDEILKSNTQIIYVNKSYLDNFIIPAGVHTFIAIKRNSLIDEEESSITISLNTDDNGYPDNNNSYTLFPNTFTLTDSRLFALINVDELTNTINSTDPLVVDLTFTAFLQDNTNILYTSDTTLDSKNSVTIEKSNLKEFSIFSDNTTNEDITNEKYFLVDSTGDDLSTNSITFVQDDILKSNTDIIYITKNYLDTYTIPDGVHTFIAIKRSALIDPTETLDITIDITNNGYKGSTNDYILFPNTLTGVTEKYLYTETINLPNIVESTLSSADKYYLVKKSDVTIVGENITHNKSAIYKTINKLEYTNYTNNITRSNTIIDKNTKVQVENILYTQNNIKYRQPLIFPIRYYSKLVDNTIIEKIFIDFLIALYDDIIENIDRNIKLDQLNQIKVEIYNKYIDKIFIGNDLILATTNKSKKYYGELSELDYYYMNHGDTYTNSNLNIIKSYNKDNLLLVHILDKDITNYYDIPIKSNLLHNYFEYLFDKFYTNESSYTILDSYRIYSNYILQLNNLNINLLSPTGYYDNSTLLSISNDIIKSINSNYKINNILLYEIINIFNNIYTYTAQNTLPTHPIHFATLFTYKNISDNFALNHFGNIDHNNDNRNKTNLVDDLIIASEADSSVTTIFYNSHINSFFNIMLDSCRLIYDTNMLKYFNNVKLWNSLLPVSQFDGITTSMKYTLELPGTSTKYDNYILAFGQNRAILNHLPYCLIMNIPYVINKIILNGGLLNSNSNEFGFSSRLVNNKSEVSQLLYQYLNLEYYETLFTGDNVYKNFEETHTNKNNTTTNKKTRLQTLETTLFEMIIGTVSTDISTYYHKDYYTSLKNDTDKSSYIYVQSAFTIEPIGELPVDTEFDFGKLENLTSIEYIINSFKRLYKEFCYDFFSYINSGNYTYTVTELTGTATDLDFSFVENIYNTIVEILDLFITEQNIISYENYINNNSIYNNSLIFTQLINNKNDHTFKFLDIQSMIWNYTQKTNIRAFNEFLYNGIFKLDTIGLVGGVNLKSYYHQIIKLIRDTLDTDTSLYIFNNEYTDDDDNSYSANLNSSFTKFSPIGETGIDFYRIRLSGNNIYESIKDKLLNENNYYNYLYSDRYENLKLILNIKNINMDKRKYTFNTSEVIIKDVSVKLINDYNIIIDSYSTELLNIIGYQEGQTLEDFSETALEVYESIITVIDIIKDSDINNSDNITNKLAIAVEAIANSAANPYNQINEENLYNWYETFKTNVLSPNLSTLYDTIKTSITSESLFEEIHKATYFNSYYDDVILFVIFIVLFTVSDISFIKTLLLDVNSEENIYNTLETTLITNITNSINTVFKISTKDDNTTDYIYETITNGYRYIPIAATDVDSATSQLQTEINNITTTNKPKYSWVKELGFRLIENVSISIGDQEIDSHSSELLSHISRVNTTNEQLNGLNRLIGNIPEMYTQSSETDRLVTSLFIPFKFWFCNNIGNAIPLISLLHTSINIKIKLRELEDILIIENGSYFVKKPKIQCKLIGNFIYLDQEERELIAKSRLEFLIEKYQYNGDKIISHKNLFNNRIRNELRFVDPTKYIYWKFYFTNLDKSYIPDINDWNKGDYTLVDSNTGEKKNIKSFELLKLKFNGRTREIFKDYNYYNYYHPYSKGLNNFEPGEFAYSFALKPLLYQPSGSANLSQIVDFTLIAQLPDQILELLQDKKIIINWKVWACSLNIFVCQSGMGALRFYG